MIPWPSILIGVILTILVYRHELFGYCECCERWFVYPKFRRQNSAYQDDRCNFVRCCLRCFEYREELWAEQWREYWSERL